MMPMILELVILKKRETKGNKKQKKGQKVFASDRFPDKVFLKLVMSVCQSLAWKLRSVRTKEALSVREVFGIKCKEKSTFPCI